MRDRMGIDVRSYMCSKEPAGEEECRYMESMDRRLLVLLSHETHFEIGSPLYHERLNMLQSIHVFTFSCLLLPARAFRHG